MRLPVSAMIGIAVIIIALVSIIAFFTMSGGGAVRRTELQNTFSQNCMSICARPDKNTINLASAYPQWQRACEELYGISPGAFVQCLELCQCGQPAAPCEFLCGFKNVVADWPSFCEGIKTHYTTSATYGSCDCIC